MGQIVVFRLVLGSLVRLNSPNEEAAFVVSSLKSTACVVSLLLGGTLYLSHSTGRLYPTLPVGASLVTTVLLLTLLRDGYTYRYSALAVVIPGVVYRVYAFLFPASLISFDPDKMAVMSQSIIVNGDLSGLEPGFYSQAAGFQVLGSVTALTTALPIDAAYLAFPLVGGLMMPLLVGSITRHVTCNDSAALVSIALSSVAGSSLRFAVAPIPLLMGSIFVASFVLVLVMTDVTPLRRHAVLVVLMLIGATVVHKLSVMLIFAGVSAYAVYTIVVASLDRSLSVRLEPAMVSLPLLFLVFQWVMYTQFFNSALFLGVELIGGAQLLPEFSGTASSPSAATRLDPHPFEFFSKILYFPLTVATAALAGLLLFRRYGEHRVRALQSFAAVTVGLTAVALLSSNPSLLRLFVYATMFCSVLVGVCYALMEEEKVSFLRTGKVALVVVLIVANLMSPVVWPDSSDSFRSYLNQTEVEAKEFTDEMATTTVYTDPFYRFKTVSYRGDGTESGFKQRGIPTWSLYENGFLYAELRNGSFSGGEYETVAFRTSVEIFWIIDGQYRLEWDPETELDKTHSSVYDNGDVLVFNDAV